MRNVKEMTNHEIRTEIHGVVYLMETSVHRRHCAPEIYAAHMKRFNELDDELAAR